MLSLTENWTQAISYIAGIGSIPQKSAVSVENNSKKNWNIEKLCSVWLRIELRRSVISLGFIPQKSAVSVENNSKKNWNTVCDRLYRNKNEKFRIGYILEFACACACVFACLIVCVFACLIVLTNCACVFACLNVK